MQFSIANLMWVIFIFCFLFFLGVGCSVLDLGEFMLVKMKICAQNYSTVFVAH
jgi:hypothetical protein